MAPSKLALHSINPCYIYELAEEGNRYADGDIDVKVYYGNEVDHVTSSGTYFGNNANITETSNCYDDFHNITVKGPTSNGWGGTIRFSYDNRETYWRGICVEGCSDDRINREIDTIFVDKDPHGNGCGSGNWCTIKVCAVLQRRLCCPYSRLAIDRHLSVRACLPPFAAIQTVTLQTGRSCAAQMRNHSSSW